MSLAEVIVGLAILSVFSVVMIGVIPSTIFGLRAENQRLIAVARAREVLEELRSRGFESLTPGVYPLPAQQRDQLVYATIYGIYQTTLPGDPNILELTHDNASARTTYQVDVTVTWTGARNQPRMHQVVTLIGRT